MNIWEISKEGTWFVEFNTPYSWHVRGIKRVLFDGQSKYQKIMVVEFEDLGKTLILDGKVQSSTYDEYIYHEALTHPVLITHPNPRKVLILGGGEGATAREVLRHKTIEEVVMVDIDEEVIKVSREYLPEIHQGAFDDPRLKVVIDDGRRYVERCKEKFDVVILDLTDPLEGGPSYLLYTVEFYTMVKNVLNDDGLMVTQATSTFYAVKTFATIYKTISTVFPITRAYHVYVPSFDSTWGFVVGSLKHDPASLTPEEVDRRIAERVKGELRFYEGKTHLAMFILPRHIRKELENPELRPATDSNPTFMPA